MWQWLSVWREGTNDKNPNRHMGERVCARCAVENVELTEKNCYSVIYIWSINLIYASARLRSLKSIFHKEIKIEENKIRLRQWNKSVPAGRIIHMVCHVHALLFQTHTHTHTHPLNGTAHPKSDHITERWGVMISWLIAILAPSSWDGVGGGRGRRGGCWAERGGVFSADPHPHPPGSFHISHGSGLCGPHRGSAIGPSIYHHPPPPPWQTTTTWAGKPKPVRVWQRAHVCLCACNAAPRPSKKEPVRSENTARALLPCCKVTDSLDHKYPFIHLPPSFPPGYRGHKY